MTRYVEVPVWPQFRADLRAILVEEDAPHASPSGTPSLVLPTPYPVLGFQFRGQLAVEHPHGEQVLDRSGITLLQSTGRRIVPRENARTVLVTLKPATAYRLLGRPLHEIADQHVGLADLLSPALVRTVEDRLAHATTTAERGDVIQHALATILATSTRDAHAVVEMAVRQLLDAGGQMRITMLAAALGIGERQLERLFREQVGTGPKRFAALVQFDWAVHQIGRNPSWSTLAADAGYADQAHLTRVFVARTGLPPSRLAPLLTAL